MGAFEPVRHQQTIRGASARQVYDVVVDFAAYPRMFREIKTTKVLAVDGARSRVEFRAEVMVAVRYVLDLVCDPTTCGVTWTFVEGEVVSGSEGGWIIADSPEGARTEYHASLQVNAPLPGFMLRKITDLLVKASLPSMFAALEREISTRRAGA